MSWRPCGVPIMIMASSTLTRQCYLSHLRKYFAQKDGTFKNSDLNMMWVYNLYTYSFKSFRCSVVPSGTGVVIMVTRCRQWRKNRHLDNSKFSVSYHRNSHEKGNLSLLYLGTNGHQSAALVRLRFILPPMFVQATVIRSWFELIRPVCSLMCSMNSFQNR